MRKILFYNIGKYILAPRQSVTGGRVTDPTGASGVTCGRVQLGRGAMVLLLTLGMMLVIPLSIAAQADDPSPPAGTVKLIFIHHSCGENWLTDDHGGLGRALGENNYFVSDTNYGWGPDSIGDRTDITNWPEWFTGPDSSRYLTALYTESGQNSWYTRTLPDPGGENQVIMFKSCFPNSNLEGGPNDPPARGEGLTVGNAKAIYNELLAYFATRPDKLFVAITAPPVQDPTYSANARAFNTWLVTEWLNGYAGSNVAVFDFYNVLTGPDNHHRFRNGAVEYITDRGGNTLYYPTNGDDHPSPAGNRKSAEEFVPLLNVYYHRWQSGAGAAPPPTPVPATATLRPTPAPPTDTPEPAAKDETPTTEPTEPPPAKAAGVIDDFESEVSEWVVFEDGGGSTSLTCGRDEANSYSGTAGLHIEYDVAPGGWASCNLIHPSPVDWRHEQGFVVYLRAERVGQPVIIMAFQGDSDALYQFEVQTQTSQEAVDGWQRVDVLWEQLVQPSWQGDSSVPFDPGGVMGLSFMFTAPDGERNSGQLWVDDISFLSAVPPAAPTDTPLPPAPTDTPPPSAPTDTPPPSAPTDTPPPPPSTEPAVETQAPTVSAESDQESGSKGLCPGSTVIGLGLLVGVFWTRRRAL